MFCRWRANGSRYPLGVGAWIRPRNGKTHNHENAQKRGAYPKSGARIVGRFFSGENSVIVIYDWSMSLPKSAFWNRNVFSARNVENRRK